MAKRFYKKNEMVWLVEDKKKAKIVELDIPNLTATVSVKLDGETQLIKKVKFMEIDKLKTPKNDIKDIKKATGKQDTVLFAKVREGAKIPSKRFEDAGYDLYASLEPRETSEGVVQEMRLYKGQKNMVPTGIASSLLPKYYFNLKHERGSTGKYGMSVLSGVVDSGYRGEIFVNIVPLFKDVIITSTVTEPEDLGEVILYPYSMAIAQGTIDLVPNLRVKEITYDELKAIPSERKDGKVGSSGK
jgi:dUTP pyrophosphatase